MATRLRVNLRKVMDWIHSGQLPAKNVASAKAKLPRFRCTEEDVQKLERRLTFIPKNQPKPTAKRRPQKREFNKYF